MIILRQKSGDVIRINDDIRISIIDTGPKVTLLAVEAPPSVKIYSEDIYLRIQAARRKPGIANADP
jgi:carbon storage regulator